MNHVRRATVIIDIKQLLRYTENILKNTNAGNAAKAANATKTKNNTKVCLLCCDDCNGSCVNRKYTPMPYSPPLLPLMLRQYK